MRLVGDDRAVAIQVGAVILLSFVVLAISAYQAGVVPDQNNEIEVDHNRQVQNEMLDLRSAGQTAGTAGGSRSVSVTLGTTYPARTIFRNPPNPSGRLRTIGTGDAAINATIAGANASGEVGDYWNGSAKSFDTGAIAYQPTYYEYDEAPATIYEHSLVYNRFPNGANRSIADQSIVDGDTITLVTLNGSLDEEGRSAASVDVRPVSVATRTVTVSNSSGIDVTLPTLAGEDVWREQLADENVSAGGNVSDVDYREGPGRVNYVTIRLAPGTYDLQLGRVGVGDNVEQGQRSDQSAYVTTVGGAEKSVRTGESFQVTAEVRDAYDNPVSGEGVTFDPSWTGGTQTATSDTDGRATTTLTAPSGSGSYTVDVRIDGGGTDARVATFDVEVSSGGGGGGGGGGAYNVTWQNPSSGDPAVTCSKAPPRGECTIDAGGDDFQTVSLTMETDPVVDGAGVTYAVSNQTVGTVDPASGTTDSSGTGTTTLNVTTNGTVLAYTSSGSDGDRINFTVTNVSTADTTPPSIDRFELTNPSSNKLQVEIDTDEQLSTISVDIKDSDGNVVENVTNFDESASGNTYTYTNSNQITVSKNENYTAVLNVAEDKAGNDGSSGETNTTKVFAYTNQNLQPTNSVGDTISSSGTTLVFEIKNTANQDLTIEQFSVNATEIGGGITIDNGSSDEFRIIGTSVQDGFANRDGTGGFPDAFNADGSKYDIENSTKSSQGNPGGRDAIVGSSDSGVDVDFRGFSQDLGTLQITEDPNEADVVVVLTLSDGTEQVFYFKQA